ncbi:MAG: caspase family protein, partial [Acidobacteria bacterium]|nr:caspase family protein [Acidobacteriota bacterium]
MRPAKLGVVLLLSLVLLASAAVALAEGRVALVVGNSTYAHIGRLPNPENDAAAVSAALRRLGFEVTTTLDAGLTELNQALRRFTRHSAGADVALVFYAGHGLEMDGVNYVVPVDARLERDVDVRYETATLQDLVASTLGASLRLVILDACRNNPLARSMQRTVARRSVSGGSFGEFDEDLLGDETLVAYAATAGTTAADGRGRNSPYTAALLAHLETPLEIGLLFRRVRAQVLEATNGQQRPHEYHSLVGEHYLTRRLPAGASVTVTAAAPPEPVPADPPRPDPSATDVTELPLAALRDLAEAGHAAAQTELGERYEHAPGVEKDYGVAVLWFRRAAEQDHAPGQAALGFLYGRGLGVEQDDAEGLRWTSRAAEQGNARAQNNLGVMYGTGRGVREDHAEAVRWYRRAAEQGHAGGQNNLGVMYQGGSGVREDHEEAVRWYRRAAEQGH